ncbi:hypothetical protein J1N09_00830 [Aureitalea sp. L0-47]|uniref:hypothetical protein n=1 Tax=Aureitalea sp. L0-47 TaxID=2816962 RepID=UPI00223779A6|nr:hypothetical protein [Aureitalea sp. L0-47]MCW5518362.1 hypothetical protein [Aureitalea sp. L0-47]
MRVTNRIYTFLLVGFLMMGTARSQETTEGYTFSKEELAQLKLQKEKMDEWITVLETPGVRIEGSKMIFSDEAQKLISDHNYRISCYREAGYTFADVQVSLQNNELQKAFWQMINLYPDHKEEVLKYIYAYDNVLQTDKVVTAAFYTYGFFDPAITKIDNGRPDVYRPDLFEGHLKSTREIVSYILYFRKQKEQKQI